MAQRRSRNRRLSRKSNNFSDILDDNTNIVDDDDAVWFDKTSIRPSMSIALSKRASSVLNEDSTAEASDASENWYNDLNRSENSKMIEENIKRNAIQQLNDKNVSNSDKNLKFVFTDSESEVESQKKRAKFRSNKKSNINDQSDVFSKALERTTDSRTKTIIDVQCQVENDSESNNDDSRTMKRLRPEVFKTKNSKLESNDFDDIYNSDNPSDRNESTIQNSQSSSKINNNGDTALKVQREDFPEQNFQDKSVNKSKSTLTSDSPKKNISKRLTQTSRTIDEQPVATREMNVSNSITEEVSKKRSVLFSQGEKNRSISNTFDAYFDNSEIDEAIHVSVENLTRQKNKKTGNESESSSIPTNIRRSQFQLRRTIQSSDSENEDDLIENKSKRKNRKSNTSLNNSTKLKDTSKNKSIKNVSEKADEILHVRNESSRNHSASASISTFTKDVSTLRDFANTSKSRFLKKSIALAKEASDRETYGSSNESRKENYHKSLKESSAKAYPNIMDQTSASVLSESVSNQTHSPSRRAHSRKRKSGSTRNDGEENLNNSRYSGIVNDNKTISTPKKSNTLYVEKSRTRENVSHEFLNKSNNSHLEINKSGVNISKHLNSQSKVDSGTDKAMGINITSEPRYSTANKIVNNSKNNQHLTSSRSNTVFETNRTTDMLNPLDTSKGSKVLKVGNTKISNTLDKSISPKGNRPNAESELYKSKTVNDSKESHALTRSNVSSVVSDKSSSPERSNTLKNGNKQVSIAESVHTSNRKSFVEKPKIPESRSKVEGNESESSVVTSSDGSYVEKNQSKMNKTSVAASLDDLLKTPNPAQSTLNPSGKPFMRITQFSFRNSTITAQTDLNRSGSPRAGDPAPHVDNPETESQNNQEDVEVDIENTDSDTQTSEPPLLSRQPINLSVETGLHKTLQDQCNVASKSKESNVQTTSRTQCKYSAEDLAKAKKELKEEIERMKELDKRKAVIKREIEAKEQKSKAIFERIKNKYETEMKKKNRKPIDKAYYWKGEPYKQPRLTFPQKWVTKRLYNYLWKCMEPKYGSRTRVKSEQLVQNLSVLYSVVIKRKEYKNYKAELAQMIMLLAENNIIVNMYDFYRFCHDYLPFAFKIKAVPMQIPGVGRTVPYNPDTVNIPILDDQP